MSHPMPKRTGPQGIPRRRLRIAICPFDTAYEYELAKLPHDFVLLGNTHRRWDAQIRPLPRALRVGYSLPEVEADVLIVGVDQRSVDALEQVLLLRRLGDHFQGPRIIVNHGSNTRGAPGSEAMRALGEDDPLICASAQARSQWDVPRTYAIRRGYDPAEWPKTNYSRGNVIACSHKGDAIRYNDGAITLLSERFGIKVARIGEGFRHFDSFDRYRSFLASSAIFFNPSTAVPNLPAMIEAQLCGLAIVTTNAHGEADYIENGVNGFASNDLDELMDFVEYLRRNQQQIEEIGERGRATAQRRFNIERFAADWDRVLAEATAAIGERAASGA
jgi:glycosyltransferase involved in cell wall biosynthesis